MDGYSEDELRRQILDFLYDFKELMGQGHYIVKDHQKNVQTLIDLGITQKIRDELILSISMRDYSSGPNSDNLHAGYYWIFGKAVDDIEIYIKLKIACLTNGNERAICISFHPSEHPLRYPFRS
jgi:hypothetical protein